MTTTYPQLGVCYYPEHWPQEQWEEDARKMAEQGLSWVRIGEFAWSRMEVRRPRRRRNGWYKNTRICSR